MWSLTSFCFVLCCCCVGEKATWPLVSLIRNHCQIELTLDEIIYRIRIRRLGATSSHQAMHGSPSLTHSFTLESVHHHHQQQQHRQSSQQANSNVTNQHPYTRPTTTTTTTTMMTTATGQSLVRGAISDPSAAVAAAAAATADLSSSPSLQRSRSFGHSHKMSDQVSILRMSERRGVPRRVKSALRMTSMATTAIGAAGVSQQQPLVVPERPPSLVQSWSAPVTPHHYQEEPLSPQQQQQQQ